MAAAPRLQRAGGEKEHGPKRTKHADLGIVTARANTGGAHAVQWSLPG
jgi:hypothetical protein